MENNTFNSSNTTTGDNPLLNRLILASIVTESIFFVANVSCDMILLAAILSSPVMRNCLKYQIILNMACSELVHTVILEPFSIDLRVRRDWVHGCYFGLIALFMLLFSRAFIVLVSFVILNAEYLIRLLGVKLPELRPLTSRLLRMFLVGAPWLLVFVVSLPIVATSIHKGVRETYWSDRYCPLFLYRAAQVAIDVFDSFIPIATNIVLTLAILGAHFYLRWVNSGNTDTHMNSKVVVEHPGYLCMAGATFVLLVLPWQVVFLVRPFTGQRFHRIAIFILNLLNRSSWIFAAIVWIASPEIRQRVKELSRWRPCKREDQAEGEEPEASFRYQHLADDSQTTPE